MSRPRVISFDLDDTLWACDGVIERSEQAVYAWLQQHYPRITQRYDLEAMRQIRTEWASARPDLQADLTRLRYETLAGHARETGYDPELAHEGVEVFLAERHRVALYADVQAVLDRLAGRFSLVTLTNGNADVGRAGFGHWFGVSLSAADVGAPKPDPAMFARVCTELGVRPGDLLHIGDDPLRDVHAARRFGARAVWLNRERQKWPGDLQRPHQEMNDLAALEAWIDSLESR